MAVVTINNSGWLLDDSIHCMNRMKERTGRNSKGTKRMLELARKRGIHSDECRWSIDRRYLESKSDENVEAIAYNGYCFIMEKMTMNCITVYALPKYFGKKKTFYRINPKCICTKNEDERY